MRRSWLIFVPAVLLLGILAAGVYYYYYRGSPRYALHQMVGALSNRNYSNFYAHLDLKSIFSHLVQDTGQDLMPPDEPEGDYLSQLGRSLGRKFAQHILPRMFEGFEKDLRRIINEYLGSLTTKELLALDAAVAMAQINRQGDEALVTLRFPKDDGRLRLTMSRAFPDRTWRVVSVSYEDLKKIVKEELK